MPTSSSGSMTRRNAVRHLGGALAATATWGLPTGAFASGSDVLRLGVVGCGGRGIGSAMYALQQEGVRITAMADVFPDHIEQSLKSLKQTTPSGRNSEVDVPLERQFVGFEACKSLLASEVDLVILATPPAFRPSHFSAAVAANKHVFLEKPLAVDGPGVRRILVDAEVARQKGLSAVAGFNRRFDAQDRAAVKAVHDGALGPISSLEAHSRFGNMWIRAAVPNETAMQFQLRNWMHFTWLSGDFIVEQHSSNIDVANWVLQANPVSARSLHAGRFRRDGHQFGDVFDEFITEFVYANGVKFYSHCRQQEPLPSDPAFDERGLPWKGFIGEIVHGPRGKVTLSPGKSKWDIPGREVVLPGARNNMYLQEIVEWITGIRTGKPVVSVESGANSTLTCIMGRMAAHQQREVSWGEAFDSTASFVPENLSWEMQPPAAPDKFGDYPVPARPR